MLPSKGKESSGSEGRIFWVMGRVKQMIRGGYFRGDSSKWKEIGIDGGFLK